MKLIFISDNSISSKSLTLQITFYGQEAEMNIYSNDTLYQNKEEVNITNNNVVPVDQAG